MDLTSPKLLVAAWVLAPGLVALASLGLGGGLRILSGGPLGALTAPAGFLAGILIMNVVIRMGGDGVLAVVACTAASLAGALGWAAHRRGRRSAAPEEEEVTGSRRAALAWPAAAGALAYAAGLAPLAGSGRSGVLGYMLNNDSAAHIAATELLRTRGTAGGDYELSSFHWVQYVNASGYPVGGHVWPMWGTVVTGLDPLHLWSPMIALAAAMLALVGYAVVRELPASRPVAALAGAVVACGYLPYSYLAQGGAKELMFPLAVYAAVALSLRAGQDGVRPRALLPAGAAAVSAIAIFGVGAGAWLGPAAVLAGGILLLRAARPRIELRTAGVLVAATALGAALTLPGLGQAVSFLRRAQSEVRDPAETGNLLGPIPVWEAFNVWVARDYRLPTPEEVGLTVLGVSAAAVLALVGVVAAARARRWAVPVAVAAAGVATAYVVSLRTAIYFEAKAYMALAPALGLATVSGLVWLYRREVRTELVAAAVGGGLAVGVALGCLYVYVGVSNTPRERFEEAAAIAERFAGQGPILVNEREDYAKHLLRAVQPWESWGPYRPKTGTPDDPYLETEHTPDFDDYAPDFVARFPLLLERRRPGGSRPPGNYRVAHETRHYRVWRRSGAPPARHLALGAGRVAGAGPLDCGRAGARRILAAARRSGRTLRAARPGPAPVVLEPRGWADWRELRPGPEPGFVVRRGGAAVLRPRLEPGRYTAYAKGSFGLGIRLLAGRRTVGEARDDFGLFANWHPLGSFDVDRGRPQLTLVGLGRPAWRAGSRRPDVSGPVAFVRHGARGGVETVPAGAARDLCGDTLDWLELT